VDFGPLTGYLLSFIFSGPIAFVFGGFVGFCVGFGVAKKMTSYG
jgi:hypothetical protein